MTEKILTAIARQHLFIDTLQTRRCDSLDFHDLSVWQLRRALEAAYEAGIQTAKKEDPS